MPHAQSPSEAKAPSQPKPQSQSKTRMPAKSKLRAPQARGLPPRRGTSVARLADANAQKPAAKVKAGVMAAPIDEAELLAFPTPSKVRGVTHLVHHYLS